MWCFNNKYKYRTLHRGKNQENKQKTKSKYSLKDCIE